LLIMKSIARQLLQALSHLHDTCHVIHTGRRWPGPASLYQSC
jgi:hypothetical protein